MIVDCFAGGGGASSGIHAALGRATWWRRRLAEFWATESAHGLARALARRRRDDGDCNGAPETPTVEAPGVGCVAPVGDCNAGFPRSERDCGQGALRAPAGYVCPCGWIIRQELD